MSCLAPLDPQPWGGVVVAAEVEGCGHCDPGEHGCTLAWDEDVFAYLPSFSEPPSEQEMRIRSLAFTENIQSIPGASQCSLRNVA